MYTSLYSASVALSSYLRRQLEGLPAPGLGFGGGGTRVVSLNSPHEMREDMKQEGLSVWLYRIERDPMRLNMPPERIAADLLRRPPMPLHLHYLMVPVTFEGTGGGAPDIEQMIMGRVIQALHAKPILRSTNFANTDLEGTGTELHVHLETLVLDELSRVWEALEGSFQLAVSYEGRRVAQDRKSCFARLFFAPRVVLRQQLRSSYRIRSVDPTSPTKFDAIALLILMPWIHSMELHGGWPCSATTTCSMNWHQLWMRWWTKECSFAIALRTAPLCLVAA